ncbi:MAG: hypothetical protein HC880_08100 [Bacteroidia bacterium]|nr:hypothetical protein [Bacteroidia bacterium]
MFRKILICRVCITALLSVGFFCPNPLSAQEQEETKNEKADEVILKYVQAIGGISNLSKISSLLIKGEGKGGSYLMTLPMTLYVKNPGKNKVEISINDQKMVMATDGKIAWGLNPFSGNGQPRQVPQEELETQNHVFYTIGKNLINYKEMGFRAEYLGKTNFRGNRVHRIRLISDLPKMITTSMPTRIIC